jgi:hypothetical protein
MKKNTKKENLILLLVLTLSISLVLSLPTGPDDIDVVSNQTKNITSGYQVNISGGYIAKLNMTATVQNPRWKAFVGWINGLFTLDDASGSTIYDWSLTSISGQVYATRSSGTITWASIGCASEANVEAENTALDHTGLSDNITATFKSSTHRAFVVGSTPILTDACDYSLNTYVGGVAQDLDFDEVVLYDSSNIIYASILQQNTAGYDNNNYDFQMIVPENGGSTWAGITPYYLYIELR